MLKKNIQDSLPNTTLHKENGEAIFFGTAMTTVRLSIKNENEGYFLLSCRKDVGTNNSECESIMSGDTRKETTRESREKTLEERISLFSTSAHETFRDLAALSRDVLYTEEGHALIRKTIEDTGRKFEDILLPETRSRTGKKEAPGEESGDFQKKEIRID